MKYIFKRIGISLIVLFGVTVIVFVLIRCQPGNPYHSMLSPDMSAEAIELKLHELGYYDPLWMQYFKWVWAVMRGDMGYSIYYNMPVWQKIIERFSNTAVLIALVFVISGTVATLLGLFSALKPDGAFDKIVSFLTFFSVSIPTFFLAMLLIKKFSYDFGLFPASGSESLGVYYTGWNAFIDKMKHIILPLVVLLVVQTGRLVMNIRERFSEIISADYIRAARMKGLGKTAVLFKHVLPVAMPDIITLLSIQLPDLISGVIITETVFVWLGLGRLSYDAVLHNDYPLIMGVTLFNAFIVLVISLFSDILCKLIDPRFRRALS